jgi:hypothetical protein
MLIAVTGVCLIVLVAQLMGASVPPIFSLLTNAWLILVGVGCAIHILGYTIYISGKVHDIHRVRARANLPEKVVDPEERNHGLMSRSRRSV